MAREYDASKEIREDLLDIKKNNRGDYLRVTKITQKASGSESLDVRNYFTNDADEVCPTSKGVRVSAELAYDLISAMLNILETSELMDMQDVIEEMIDKRGDNAADSGEMTTQGDN